VPLATVGLLTVLPGSLRAQEGLVVRQLAFDGNKAVDDVTLAAAIATTNSSWFARTKLVSWVGLGEKRRLDERNLRRDVERIRLLYRISGYLEVQVDTLIRRTATDAFITFRITEGAPVVLTAVQIGGLDSLPRPDRLVRDLPLEAGDPFNRERLRITADTLANRLKEIGYPAATVFLERRQVDSARRQAEVDLRVEPGPKAVFGSVVVEAPTRDSALVTRLLVTKPGAPFSQSDLLRSQQNLAASELYRFASVQVDTARLTDPLDSVPLVVRVLPAKKYRLNWSGGYGTDDCFRMNAGVTVRNPLGVGRLLEVQGRISKIGTGDPLDFGLDERLLCKRLKEDPIGSSKLNYAASISWRRPAFLSPDNSIALTGFAERRSEFAVYLREEVGGALTAVRETRQRIPITVGYRLAYGFTTASAVNFCAYFNACNPVDVAVLEERQRQGVISVGISRLRVNNLLDPTRGTSIGLQASHSAAWTLSDSLQRFTRFVGDASWYYPVSRSVVAALRLRAGVLISPPITGTSGQEEIYVPPDQRFYAGGANDVRGYDRNELGPVVYVVLDTAAVPGPDGQYDPSAVQVSPVGGDRSVTANAEVRFPSPVFGSFTRLVAFVDAGSVWSDELSGDQPTLFRVTPGAGIRIASPLGPARLDVAWNGYGYPAGPLYVVQPDGSLVIKDDRYAKPRNGGFTFHLAIGQAF
jgi:outer membrane protein assembly complex protein YaeT